VPILSVLHGGRERVVDVGTWGRVLVGADGGVGAPSFCAPLALHPALFGATVGAEVTLEVGVLIVFPDNDITRVHARLSMMDPATGRPLAPVAASVVEQSAEPLWTALRALGGSSSAATFSATIRCQIRNGLAPQARPAPSR
jgi:hypothetical protein